MQARATIEVIKCDWREGEREWNKKWTFYVQLFIDNSYGEQNISRFYYLIILKVLLTREKYAHFFCYLFVCVWKKKRKLKQSIAKWMIVFALKAWWHRWLTNATPPVLVFGQFSGLCWNLIAYYFVVVLNGSEKWKKKKRKYFECRWYIPWEKIATFFLFAVIIIWFQV